MSLNRHTAYHVGGYTQTGIFSERVGDAHCTCKAFKYARGSDKTCKHIEQARKEACGWNSFIDEGEPTADGKCPRCGADTFTVMYGV